MLILEQDILRIVVETFYEHIKPAFTGKLFQGMSMQEKSR